MLPSFGNVKRQSVCGDDRLLPLFASSNIFFFLFNIDRFSLVLQS
jgi:hypothetical protein